MKRLCGIIMNISSLPSDYGVGTLGSEAYRFADFLKRAGQSCWQVLPQGPTGYGDSPYQSFSAFAGNPYFIDLDTLAREGLLRRREYAEIDWGSGGRVDYEKIYDNRFGVLKKACDRFDAENGKYAAFCAENAGWLRDYALFMAIKSENKMAAWHAWSDAALRAHDETRLKEFENGHKEELDFWKFTQFKFFEQWGRLKKYVNGKGIRIIGDVPIYAAADSADVWACGAQFLMNGDVPAFVAGCPPDGFCADGQLWGNPVYDWEYMRENGFEWWLERLSALEKMYDIIRLDHFRGLESYYRVKYGETTARDGEWAQGPGMEFINAVKRKLGDFPIIAEDLGFLTPEVKALREQSGYPGMKVLEFAFGAGEDSEYLPHKYEENCVVYTGTHDNDTVCGWFDSLSEKDREFAVEYARLNEKEGYNWGMLRLMYESKAFLAVAQMQDFLGLGSEARMNRPAVAQGNWQWRAEKGALNNALAKRIKALVKKSGRI